MAQLTPLSKGLITLAVVGAAASAVWHLGLKSTFSDEPPGAATDTDSAGAPAPSAPVAKPAAKGKGVLGSAGNPLKISLVSFHGYAPALVANGNSLTTKPGSIFAGKGLDVQFVIQDDIPTLATIFESGAAHCAWRTSDFWAQEHPNLRNARRDAKAIVVVDNTRGGDAIIARDPAIRTVEDLAGRSTALLQFTPSHGLLTDALENSSLTARKREQAKKVFINAEEGTAGVRAAFVSGNVDAAVLWDPDLSLALRDVKGAHVVYSTKTATNLIYDVMVCDAALLAQPDNEAVFQQFVDGWMAGVDVAKANPDEAVSALVATEEFFDLLAKKEGKPFVKSLFDNLLWTGLEDNVRILGLTAGGTNHYERVYRRFDQIYRAEGALANPNSPVINPQESFDYRFIRNLLARNQQAVAAASAPQDTFTEQARERAMAQAAPQVTKPVMVNFPSGSAELTKRAMQVIDKEMVPFIENNGSAYFELGGNTDSVGAYELNMRLSHARATAVVDYLVKQWEIPASRLKIAGHGPSRPICNEKAFAAEGLSLEECRALNRTTRIAVYSNN